MSVRSGPERNDSPARAAMLVVAASSLGLAIQIADGRRSAGALLCLGLAIVACAAAVLLPENARRARFAKALLLPVFCAAIALQIVNLYLKLPGIYLQLNDIHEVATFFAGVGVAALAGGVMIGTDSRRLRQIALAGMIACFLFLGTWTIVKSDPKIDVFYYQTHGSQALLHGQNPYTIEVPDGYRSSNYIDPSLRVGGRLAFGYPYLPLTLVPGTAAAMLHADVRFGQLAAMAVTGLLIATLRPTRCAAAAAMLFLFTPRAFFVLEQAWTEPFVVMLLAAVIWCQLRKPALSPIAWGLFLASKQYAVLSIALLPIALAVRPPSRGNLRFVILMLAAAAAVSLTLAIWDLPAFWRSAVAVQFHQPMRPDALSYLPVLFPQGSASLAMLAFLAAAITAALCLWRAPRNAGACAASIALVFLIFFAFNKQAFANYYFFVIGGMCCAAAASGPAEPIHSPQE